MSAQGVRLPGPQKSISAKLRWFFLRIFSFAANYIPVHSITKGRCYGLCSHISQRPEKLSSYSTF